jgi:hypothetical protein
LIHLRVFSISGYKITVYIRKYCDGENNHAFAFDVFAHIQHLWIRKFWFWNAICLSIYVPLISTWTGGWLLFILDIQEFIHHRLVPREYEHFISKSRSPSDGSQTTKLWFSWKQLKQFWLNFSKYGCCHSEWNCTSDIFRKIIMCTRDPNGYTVNACPSLYNLQPAMVYQTTVSFVSKPIWLRSVIYEEVCAVFMCLFSFFFSFFFLFFLGGGCVCAVLQLLLILLFQERLLH